MRSFGAVLGGDLAILGGLVITILSCAKLYSGYEIKV